nr:hypothetical protein [Candidatus Mycobacterium methanotrophicum]
MGRSAVADDHEVHGLPVILHNASSVAVVTNSSRLIRCRLD